MGLGEVERFIPGEQAVGERRRCQSSRDPSWRHGLLGGLDTGPAAHLRFTLTPDAALRVSQEAPPPPLSVLGREVVAVCLSF